MTQEELTQYSKQELIDFVLQHNEIQLHTKRQRDKEIELLERQLALIERLSEEIENLKDLSLRMN
jgi:hypothetical protein